MPLGTKKYKFEFDLPEDGHNSFAAPGASFSYMLKCTVDIPWGIDAEGSLELFVNEVKDLNDSIGKFSQQDGKTLTGLFQRRWRRLMNKTRSTLVVAVWPRDQLA